MIMNKYVNKLRRKLAFLFYNPYIELANLHNEYVKIYPNLAVFSFDRISLEIIFHGLYEKNLLLNLSKNLLSKKEFQETICLISVRYLDPK